MHSIDVAALLLRLAVGLAFAAHGSQKAFGWWGGPGPQGWGGAITAMGFRPVWLFTWVSILAELVAGLLLAAGFLTPAMAAVLVAQSVVIVFKVHWAKGFFSQKGGFEYPLLLAVAAVAVAIMGPGQISVDHVIGLAPDAAIRGGLLVIGAVGGFVALGISMVGRGPQPAAPSR
jgi:putative oxidoreductase